MSISEAASKLSQAVDQTTETINVVERAMKRPKTAIDLAMEKSPAKMSIAGDASQATIAPTSLLRSRLALHLGSKPTSN
ncbi:TPA: hypothetical protein N0F65_002696 [Lagenidium giganteum]|uniref:Uncharacterized protein n=1 Tax=Lagenidium giganteum TaxID=4803 RepID=A0AAV2Z528_9STRA|nr:TPA: hypothetical protein N0F65_002696 [Lagenidium giganteum]